MKQIKNENENVNSEKLSIKKVGTILGSGAICVALAGVISISGLFDKNSDAVKKDESSKKVEVQTVSNKKSAAEEKLPETTTHTTLDTVLWRKASINEYEIAQTQKIKLTQGTKSTTTTSATAKETTSKTERETSEAKKKEASTQASTKNAETSQAQSTQAQTQAETTTKQTTAAYINKIMYTNDQVNMRKSAGTGTSSKIINTLSKGEKVKALKKTSVSGDTWYLVTYNDMKGYIKGEFLTENAPAATSSQSAQSTQSAQSSTQNQYASSVINYTTEEFDMLCYVLEGEVGQCSDASKLAVANVIINRVKSPSFPNTISGVLTSGNQFTAVNGYYNKTTVPSQSTINCAQRALNGEDNSNGAVYYYAPRYCGSSSASWFETLTFCMELEGQRFFK